MDVHGKLDAIVETIEGARAVPMSASCMVNRGELLAALDELRALLPVEVDEARRVISERDEVIEEGRLQAEALLEEARAERSRMLAATEVTQEAGIEARRVVDDATAAAERMRSEVEDYVDGKLANFEIVLNKTLAAVQRGRAKLAGAGDELATLSGSGADPDGGGERAAESFGRVDAGE